jgi:mannose-6-phosphate isomerase-like protein (cupin superfamily)
MVELRRAEPGASFLVITDVITVRVTSAQSSGRLCVVEALTAPGGGPPPLHSHPPDEVFTVLEGEATIFVREAESGLRRTTLRAGESAHVPGGVAHTFRNFSDAPLRLLATFAPGQMMEHYFVAGGIALPDARLPDAIDADRQAQQASAILLLAANVGMVVHDELT